MSPPVTIELSIDGHQYSGHSGQLLTGQQAIRVGAGQRVAFQVGIQAAANVRVLDLWLVVNSYQSGFDGNHGRPTGKYRLVLHHAGSLEPGQHLAGTWTATQLFGTGALDLTAHYAAGDFGISTVLGHLDVVAA